MGTKGTQPVVRPPDLMVGEDNQTTANNLYIVFDTNTWLYDFDDIKEILYDPYLSFRNYENNFKIGLPYVLYDEFDNIKKYYRDTPEKKTARQVDKLIKDLRA